MVEMQERGGDWGGDSSRTKGNQAKYIWRVFLLSQETVNTDLKHMKLISRIQS